MTPVAVELDPELLERAEVITENRGQSIDSVIEAALRRYLGDRASVERAPVYRIAEWFTKRAETRRTMCEHCGNAPRREGDFYCSDACAREAAWAQANGG